MTAIDYVVLAAFVVPSFIFIGFVLWWLRYTDRLLKKWREEREERVKREQDKQ